MSEPDSSPHLGPLLDGEREKKAPRWTIPFLRALERTGNARAAAEDAGIDHTTAYGRRKAHADFAAAWAEALEKYRAERKRVEEEGIAALRSAASPGPSTIPSAGNGPPPPDTLGEELVASNGQLKRVGRERWGKRKEALFLDELTATANVRRAAKAAGVSANAVLARRRRHPLFAAKWEAAVANARASIDLHLLEEAKKTFDPETLGTVDVAPRVTIDQAIKISQLGGSKKQAPAADAFSEDEYSYEDDIADIREGLVQRLQAMRQRDRPELLARGWSYDESWDRDIPPGWIKGPEWRPMEAGDEY
jgi:hypothetical protein